MSNPRKPTLAEWMEFMYDPQQAIDYMQPMTQLDDLIGEKAWASAHDQVERTADAESDDEDQ